MKRELTPAEQHALQNGLATFHRGRLIPIIRGGDDSDPPADPPADLPADPPAPPTFQAITSQEDFDRRIQERLARVKQTPPADYDELKAAKKRLDELEAANKTELEKATDRAAAAERKALEAETKAHETALRSAIVAEAAKRNLADPTDAIALLDRASLEFDDDGTPTNIAEAMDSLLEAKPHLAAGGIRAGGAEQGARGRAGGNQLAGVDGMSPDDVAKALAEGRLDDYLRTPN